MTAAISLLFVAPLVTVTVVQDAQRVPLDLSSGAAEFVVDESGAYWLAGRGGRLFRSVDEGGAWDDLEVDILRHDQPGHLRLAAFGVFSGDRALLLAPTAAFTTRDGGLSWSEAILPPGFVGYECATRSDGLGAIVGPHGALFTSDYGLTWERSLGRLTEPGGEALRCVTFGSETSCFVGGLQNRLFVTENGGYAWKRLPTPVDCVGPNNDRSGSNRVTVDVPTPSAILGPPIESLLIWEGSLLASQGGAMYIAEDARRVADWRPLVTTWGAVVRCAVHPSGLAVLDSKGYVSVLGPDLQEVWSSGRPVSLNPLESHLAVDGSFVLVSDGRTQLSRVTAEGIADLRLLHRCDEGVWAVGSIDRTANGAYWGVGRYDLLYTRNEGERWTRKSRLPNDALGAILAVTDGMAPSVFFEGGALKWDADVGELVALPALHGVTVRGLLSKDGAWLAFGRRCSNYGELMAGRDSFPELAGVFIGSGDGRSWNVIGEWSEVDQVESVYWFDDGRLIALGSGGKLRTGGLSINGDDSLDLRWTGESASISARRGVLVFDGEFDGAVVGGETHLVTDDGGVTWSEASDHRAGAEIEYVALRNGSVVRVVREERIAGEIHTEFAIYQSGEWKHLRGLVRPLGVCSATSDGGLTCTTVDGTVITIEAVPAGSESSAAPESSRR